MYKNKEILSSIHYFFDPLPLDIDVFKYRQFDQ